MLRLLSQPAQHILEWKTLLLRYFAIGLFIAFFLIVFQPFGTAGFRMPYKNLFLSGYGWISFLVFALYHGITLLLFPTLFEEERWVVWKEVIFLLLGLSLTFFACYAYKQLWFGWPISLFNFSQFYLIGLSISIFPMIGITLAEYIIQLKKHQIVAATINQQIPTKPAIATSIHFKDENDKEDFTIPQDQLLFIKAANNYVEINYIDQEQVKKYLLRNSLGTVENQLDYPAIKRCHRSYLVNIDKVGRITGNAQGYKLHFPFTSEYVVPVSRSKGKELLDLLKES